MARTTHNSTKLLFTNIYHKFLVDNFGGIHLEGCKQLAILIDWYQLNVNLQDLYKKYADKYGTTSDAVERNVRTYLTHINKQYTKEQLEEMFGYKFTKSSTTRFVLIPEFIAIVKYYLQQKADEQESEE